MNLNLEQRLSEGIDAVQERLPGPVSRVLERLRGEDLLLSASGLAFYGLVSVAPLLIASLWIASLVMGDQRVQDLSSDLTRIAPQSPGIGSLLQHVAKEGTSLGLPAFLVALWPATAYGSALRRAFHRLSPRGSGALKGLAGRGLAVLVLFPLFVAGAIGSSLLATTLVGEGVLGGVGGIALGLVLGFAGAIASIAAILRIFPPEDLSWGEIWRASVFTAAGVAVLSAGFALYVSLGANFEQSYATSSIAGIVLFGVWLFLSNAWLLVGFQLALED